MSICKKLLVFISCVLIASSINATDNITDNEVDVYFVNGILNNVLDFNKSITALKDKLGVTVNSKKLHYKKAYFNLSEGTTKDLLEAYHQAIESGQMTGPRGLLWSLYRDLEGELTLPAWLVQSQRLNFYKRK